LNVKKAFQLFNHTFAAAIKITSHRKELNIDIWEATNFAKRMNNVIAAFNA